MPGPTRGHRTALPEHLNQHCCLKPGRPGFTRALGPSAPGLPPGPPRSWTPDGARPSAASPASLHTRPSTVPARCPGRGTPGAPTPRPGLLVMHLPRSYVFGGQRSPSGNLEARSRCTWAHSLPTRGLHRPRPRAPLLGVSLQRQSGSFSPCPALDLGKSRVKQSAPAAGHRQELSEQGPRSSWAPCPRGSLLPQPDGGTLADLRQAPRPSQTGVTGPGSVLGPEGSRKGR